MKLCDIWNLVSSNTHTPHLTETHKQNPGELGIEVWPEQRDKVVPAWEWDLWSGLAEWEGIKFVAVGTSELPVTIFVETFRDKKRQFISSHLRARKAVTLWYFATFYNFLLKATMAVERTRGRCSFHNTWLEKSLPQVMTRYLPAMCVWRFSFTINHLCCKQLLFDQWHFLTNVLNVIWKAKFSSRRDSQCFWCPWALSFPSCLSHFCLSETGHKNILSLGSSG